MSLAHNQAVTLHFKHLSGTRVSRYAYDEDLGKVTVTFQLQSDKTRAYKEYTTMFVVTPQQLLDGSAAVVATAYENVWALHHDDMVAFVAAEAVKPSSNQVFQVPTYQ